MTITPAEDEEEKLQRRRVPCMITYLNPFRVIETEKLSPWDASIDQINHAEWDYVALHEMVGSIDVGLDAPYHLVVGRDGALGLPPLENLRSPQASVEFFNRCLAGLLLGGIYCEAITLDSLDIGSIIDWKYIRSIHAGPAGLNQFHEHVRRRQASPMEAIALVSPRTVGFAELQKAMSIGLRVLDSLPTIRAEYLLKGTTGIARLDWGAALSNLWIVVEQLLAELWKREVLEPSLKQNQSRARRDQLLDSRTWTASI